jgi:hypothetical protein
MTRVISPSSSTHNLPHPPLKKLFVQGSLPVFLRIGWRSDDVLVANCFNGFLQIMPHPPRNTCYGFVASRLEEPEAEVEYRCCAAADLPFSSTGLS